MNKPLFPDVTVNGHMISAADIAAEAQNHAAPKGKPGLAWRQAAKALVIRHLLLEEVGRIGMVAEPEDLGGQRFETQEEADIRALMEAGIEPAPVLEAGARSVYDADPERFRAPSLYEAAHILIAADPRDPHARDKARKEAEAVLHVLKDRPERFDAFARSESACASRDNGGRLGQLTAGDTVPEFEAALDRLAEGAISEAPVASRYGFHIIRLDARARGAVLPFEAVKDRIVDALERKAWAEAAAAFVGDLVSKARVVGLDMDK
ncbi:MAG: peptidylprolyl isomerase [Paracoccaceae bacterium]